MKRLLVVVALLLGLIQTAYGAEPIVVSCYRGPWEAVIWDRPNAIFVETLMTYGYSLATATDIAEQICRDVDLVGNPEAAKDKIHRLMAAVPKDAQ